MSMIVVKLDNGCWGYYYEGFNTWGYHREESKIVLVDELPPDLQVKILLLNLAPARTVIEKVGMKITDYMYEIYKN